MKAAEEANDYDFTLSIDDYSNLVEYEKNNGPLSFIYRNEAQSLISLTSRSVSGKTRLNTVKK